MWRVGTLLNTFVFDNLELVLKCLPSQAVQAIHKKKKEKKTSNQQNSVFRLLNCESNTYNRVLIVLTEKAELGIRCKTVKSIEWQTLNFHFDIFS